LDWREAAVGKGQDRAAFDCSEPALNDYLRNHARQNHDRGVSKTFVALAPGDAKTVLGYYSLSPASVDFKSLPEAARRGAGRYDVSGFRLGRLAVALSEQGKGLGGQLLLSAARRCISASAEVGGTFLFIDAKSPRAAAWYAGYGAVPLIDTPLSLVLPLATAEAALRAAGKI
jgi:GNAT superfamily N-acetyltransferase